MGRIIKYNVAKGDDGERIKSVVFGSASSGYPTVDSTKEPDNNEMSVILWGNNFHGIEDLQGTITVTNGDIFIKFDEEDFDPEDYEDDEIIPSGSLYVDGSVYSNTATIGMIYSQAVYGDDVYINYPQLNGAKKNIRTIFINLDDRCEQNTDNIDVLFERVSQAENNIEKNYLYIEEVDHKRLDLLRTVNDIEEHQTDQDTMINTNVKEITDLKQQVSNIGERLMHDEENIQENTIKIQELTEIINRLQNDIEDIQEQISNL